METQRELSPQRAQLMFHDVKLENLRIQKDKLNLFYTLLNLRIDFVSHCFSQS